MLRDPFHAMVRKAGLEPACLSAPPPQDGVSANSTTSARDPPAGAEESLRTATNRNRRDNYSSSRAASRCTLHHFTIALNDLGSRLAPPTSAPSISLCDISACAL